MADMQEQFEILKQNDEIRLKYRRIEKGLAEHRNVTDLFGGLLQDMDTEFGIPYLWVSIIDADDISDIVTSINKASILKDRLSMINESSLGEIFGETRTSILANEELKNYYKLLPKNMKFFMKSLAIAPIRLQDRLVGSLNCGDPTSIRYQPGMDTHLLDQLAEQISIRLTILTASGAPSGLKSGDIKETGKR
jgi:uncharacterized protein YigA (DUF484 family)